MEFCRNSSLLWISMNFDVPCDDIMDEYVNVRNSLILHRPEDGHQDWYAVTLFGTGSKKTNSHWEYGLRQKKDLTDIGKLCPKTMNWIMSLPYARIDDVRYLVIKPGGFIAEHIDVPDRNWLEPLNISITYPEGNEFFMNGEVVPYCAGTSMVLNIHYPHKVINNSQEDRLHLLIHGKKKKEFWNYVKDYCEP